jgi:hypothetical protein
MSLEESSVHEKYLDRILSFTKEQQEAYKMVLVSLSAVGKVAYCRDCTVHLGAEDMHLLFKVFCEKLALEGEYFDRNQPFSPAVALYLARVTDEKESIFKTIIFPYQCYYKAPWRIDEHPDKQKLLEAAVEVCKVWLPRSNWAAPE